MSRQPSAVSRQPNEDRELIAVCNRVAVPVEAPDRVLIVPWGQISNTGVGGDYLVDEAAAKSILAEFSSREGTPLVIDYEHGSEGGDYTPPNGIAPAAGWISSLESEPGVGIWGRVEWTRPGAEYVRTKQYRYLSPSGWREKSSGRLLAIKSVGLVNQPGIVGMRPIVNKTSAVQPSAEGDGLTGKGSAMNEILKALGLKDGATEAECVSAISKMQTDLKAATSRPAVAAAISRSLALPETATEEQVVEAISKAKTSEPNPSKFVPMDEHSKVTSRVAALEAELSAGKSATFIERGIKAGKITSAMKGMWERAFKSDPAQAEKDLEAAPVIAPADGRVISSSAGAASGGNDRQAVISREAAEWEAHRNDREMFASKAAFINDGLRVAGLKIMTKEEMEKAGAEAQ